MPRDPHADLPAMKLDLSLRETNVTLADEQFDIADALMVKAMSALERIPAPADVVSSLIYGQAHAAAAAAIYSQVNAKMQLEYERALVAHERAHLEHVEGEQQRQQKIAGIQQEGMRALAERLRDAGFDPQVMRGFGVIIPPDEEQGPNS